MSINKKPTKKIILWIVVATIVTVTGFLIFGNKNKKADYTLIPVGRRTLTRTISANGEYLSKDEASISFRISGPLTSVKVDVGDRVKQGQFLASVDTGTLTEKLEQAKKAVTIQKKILAYQKDKDDLYTKDQRNAQKAAVQQAEIAVDEISKQFQYANLYAPISGIVVEKNANIGEIIQAGNPVIKIVREDEMRIEVRVPEVDIADVKIGQKASVKFDAYPENRRFEAEVAEIDPAPINIQNVTYYIVKMNLKNPDAGLKYGMGCTVYVETDRKDNTLMIPKGVIEKDGDKKFVTVLTDAKEKTVEKREIQTGLEGDDGMVEIISGLNDNDQIATEK
ncbi:MAG: efflux RND transporter periplasmic adaptor subunit [Candidatus Moranbacteria bacterium]|nr:efflux RND transporter periplasmic adaptor subunit [Candidatus Moranbacteria bacterium]